jgi:hypothetical protein
LPQPARNGTDHWFEHVCSHRGRPIRRPSAG